MNRLSRSLFVGALLLLAYMAGSATDGGRKLLAAAETTYRGLRDSFSHHAIPLHRFVDTMATDAAAQRVRLLAPTLAGAVLMVGGRHRFRDHCPGFVGCVALEYDRHGRLVHAYPFRPEAYEAALVPHGLAAPIGYEPALGFDFAEHADVFAIDSYSNGDLSVVFSSNRNFPPALGVARIDREGRPRWYRADGSHHWPTVAHGRLRGGGAGLQDALVVAGRQVSVGSGVRAPGDWERLLGRGSCSSYFADYLNVIDGDGVLLRQVSVVDAVATSRHRPLLYYNANGCDPLHLNSVDLLAAAGAAGLAAGDFLVSLRGLGALAVLGGRDGELKGIWRGSFYGQHGARMLAGPAGPAFLMFDNWGRGEGRLRSAGRLLALDPRSGRERTIFPNASTPATVELHSEFRGGVSIAPGGRRAIVFAHNTGQGVEVDLASGAATAVFQALDDVSALVGDEDKAAQAYRWSMRDIRYVATPARSAM